MTEEKQQFGAFSLSNKREHREHAVELASNQRNGPVEVSHTPEWHRLHPDIGKMTLSQYFDWLETLTEREIKIHLRD